MSGMMYLDFRASASIGSEYTLAIDAKVRGTFLVTSTFYLKKARGAGNTNC